MFLEFHPLPSPITSLPISPFSNHLPSYSPITFLLTLQSPSFLLSNHLPSFSPITFLLSLQSPYSPFSPITSLLLSLYSLSLYAFLSLYSLLSLYAFLSLYSLLSLHSHLSHLPISPFSPNCIGEVSPPGAGAVSPHHSLESPPLTTLLR